MPNVQSANKRPEKQIAAIPMKKMNSHIMARRELERIEVVSEC
jgi:hypothetical protein